jgi:hypothetical protein
VRCGGSAERIVLRPQLAASLYSATLNIVHDQKNELHYRAVIRIRDEMTKL